MFSIPRQSQLHRGCLHQNSLLFIGFLFDFLEFILSHNLVFVLFADFSFDKVLGIFFGLAESLNLSLFVLIFLLQFLELHFPLIDNRLVLSLLVEPIDQPQVLRVSDIVLVLKTDVFREILVGLQILIFLRVPVLLSFVVE